MASFDFDPRTRIVFGAGRIAELGAIARDLGSCRALVVSDAGLVAAGHAEHGLASLREAGLDTALFDRVHENPTTADVDLGVAAAREFQPDLLVGLGGGSSMDCAKGINFLHSCGGRMHDYWGTGKSTGRMLPMIAVPTTAGTGSETQSFALISDAETHVKMACGDKRAACRVALLDPELTVTQPQRVTALTGLDAMAHAIESFVTTRKNPASLAFSREAWRFLDANLARVLRDPNDLAARGGMQLGACFAGLAIENSMLGAAHALANPLTAHYGVPHGQAVAVMLPHVVRYNGTTCERLYHDLLAITVDDEATPPPEGGAGALAEFYTGLMRLAELPTTLSELGIERSSLASLATEAAKQWTAQFNPRPVGPAELQTLYEAAY
ncbi:MAG: iron-containing alcohol dehydrogenase [Pirellulales bacterium]|nr:iron-containing alcohol dehydrogenase [Pirellulales bacterium]